MTEYKDISVPIDDGTLVYPADPKPHLTVSDNDVGGWNVGRYEGGLHVGTHIDAPWHRIQKAKRVHEIPLDTFVGKCYVADLTDRDHNITSRALTELGLPPNVERLILKTRNSSTQYWVEDWNQNAISLDGTAADWCVSRSLRLVGIDYLSVERAGESAIHDKLLGNEIIILEGLYLPNIPSGWYELIAPPIKLIGADGAWCRALLATCA